MLYLTSIEAFSHSASCIHPSARITPVRRHVIVIWRDFIFEKEKKRRNGTRRWTKKTPNSFFSFSSRDDEGDRKCGSSGTPVTSTGRPTTTRHSSRQAQTRRYSRPAAKTQNLWANSISNNRKQNRQKRSTRCLRDFISLELTNLLLKGVGSRRRRRRVKCRIVSYNYFIRFLTRIPASLLAWATPTAASRLTLAVWAFPSEDKYSTSS